MASITTRAGKGTPLTNAEVDANFTNLNTELGQKLVAASNLSDLASSATARTNLGVAIGSNVQAWDADLDAIAALTGTSGFLRKTAANTWSLDTSTYLTGNQSITFTGDATGSGSTSVALTLANSGAVAGTYGSSTNIPQIAVDAKGRITSVSNVAVSIPSGSLTFTGDVTGTGTTGSSTALTLANSGVTAGAYTKVTVDAKGRVTVGASLASADLPTYTGTLTSTQVTTALGFTPYNSTNPNGYITSSALSSYLPLSGGTVSGRLTMSSQQALGNERRYYVGSLYANGVTPNRFEIARVYIDYNDWHAAGTILVELQNRYYTGGDRQVYSISYDYNIVNCDLIESIGPRGRGARVVCGSPIQVSGDSYYIPVYVDARYYNGYDVYLTTSWPEVTSHGAHAGAILVYQSPSGSTTADFNAVEDVVMRANSLTLSGNTVLHAGNYSSYAVALAGGTMNGKLTITASAGLDLHRLTFDADSTDSYYRTTSGNRHRFTTTGGADFIIGNSSGVATLNGNQLLHAGNYTSYALPLSGGTVSGTVRINSQLQVGQNTNGTAYIDAFGGIARFGRDSTAYGLHIDGNHFASFVTGNGYVQIGPLNASYSHFQTDRPSFYFNRDVLVDGQLYRYSGSLPYLHSGNYTSYSPTLTGSGASGTWSINITGSAGSASTATTATNWGSYGGVPAAGTSFGNANTIGRSDANGYTYFNYINSNTSNSENPSVSQVIVTNGGDNFYRKASISHLTSAVQSNASGTWSINVTGSAGSATTASTANALNTGNNYQMNSLGVGTGASGTAGEIRATNNVTAYYSDDRLKTRLGLIENALDKVCALNGFYYEANETAQALGYEAVREVGLSAQETQAVLPEVVVPAPIDAKYLTIRYEKVIPLIVEAIKELRAEVAGLKSALQ